MTTEFFPELPDDPASRALRSKALRDESLHELRQTIEGQKKVIAETRRELAAVTAERDRFAVACRNALSHLTTAGFDGQAKRILESTLSPPERSQP